MIHVDWSRKFHTLLITSSINRCDHSNFKLLNSSNLFTSLNILSKAHKSLIQWKNNCLSELEQLRQRLILCDTLSYTVEFLREQLNASKAREDKLTNALQHVSNKLGVSVLLFEFLYKYTRTVLYCVISWIHNEFLRGTSILRRYQFVIGKTFIYLRNVIT